MSFSCKPYCTRQSHIDVPASSSRPVGLAPDWQGLWAQDAVAGDKWVYSYVSGDDVFLMI